MYVKYIYVSATDSMAWYTYTVHELHVVKNSQFAEWKGKMHEIAVWKGKMHESTSFLDFYFDSYVKQ